ncbi:hypothetical protein F5Y17DRAFT_44331 [Xylariaceae sp. FL0594]|nr:hypothetical protein F5Y17DRAFT_44331 [Xylariaceae sp. FL0594]
MERSLVRSARAIYTRAHTPRVHTSRALGPAPACGRPHTQIRHGSSAPSVLQLSFWKSLIPKPLRPKPKSAIAWGKPDSVRPKVNKGWNPATFFIAIFTLIGSMSIQMIMLKRDHGTFLRRAEARIGVLREVVERIQRGEEVDVEKSLGTGDKEQEKDWEEALREIERSEVPNKNVKKSTKIKTASTPSPTTSESNPEPMPTSPASTDTTKAQASLSNFF